MGYERLRKERKSDEDRYGHETNFIATEKGRKHERIGRSGG